EKLQRLSSEALVAITGRLLAPSPSARFRTANDRLHAPRVERLGDVVEGTQPQRLDGALIREEARDDYDLDGLVDLADPAERLHAADSRHREVEQHDVDRLGAQSLESFFSARDGPNSVARAQEEPQRLPHPRLVVDDE